MKRILFALLVLGTVTGCQPANISAVMRGSDRDNASMVTRCEPTDMRNEPEMKQVLSKYDGWRMIYLSEFTTSNMVGTAGVICFERAKQ